MYVQDLTKAAGFSIALAAQMIAYAKQTIISVLQLTSWAADSYKKEEYSFTPPLNTFTTQVISSATQVNTSAAQ